MLGPSMVNATHERRPGSDTSSIEQKQNSREQLNERTGRTKEEERKLEGQLGKDLASPVEV